MTHNSYQTDRRPCHVKAEAGNLFGYFNIYNFILYPPSGTMYHLVHHIHMVNIDLTIKTRNKESCFLYYIRKARLPTFRIIVCYRLTAESQARNSQGVSNVTAISLLLESHRKKLSSCWKQFTSAIVYPLRIIACSKEFEAVSSDCWPYTLHWLIDWLINWLVYWSLMTSLRASCTENSPMLGSGTSYNWFPK